MKAAAPRRRASINFRDLEHLSEELRQDASRQLDPGQRADRGQYFTPWSTALLMARMTNVTSDSVRLLDPGAGTGALTAAWLSEICVRERRPTHVEVAAYELDEALVPYLRTMLDACQQACSTMGVTVTANIETVDFIEAGPRMVSRLALGPDIRFDVAILNPPYRKIRSDSQYRTLLRSVGMETSNLYTAFVSLVLPMLRPGGEMVAITPRSFCNGPYFRPFRKNLLKALNLQRIHVFEARDEAFSDDDVLQENIIVHGVRAWNQDEGIRVSCSKNAEDTHVISRLVSSTQVVRPNDRESFIHVVPDEWGHAVSAQFSELPCKLEDLGLSVSTGRVVDFRALDALCAKPEPKAVPLIYPRHFENGFVSWPCAHPKKADAIKVTERTRELLVDSGIYVLVKRFSAKEERRRVVAAMVDPGRVPAPLLGFENHLNYFHELGGPLSRPLALGLTAYLNSTLLDSHFRQFSGHTQVNATDLRNLRYPRRATLEELGNLFENGFPAQEELDHVVEGKAINVHASGNSPTDDFRLRALPNT